MTSKPLALSAALFSVYIFVIACSTKPKQAATPALFNTKAEAEKAAKTFNCQGAHKMGDQWMPCSKHGNHQHNHELGH